MPVQTRHQAQGATRMFAPHPLEPRSLAACHLPPRLSAPHARRQVAPGARLLSGERYHSTKRARTGGSIPAAVSARPPASASARPSPSASVIWVSSVTYAVPEASGSSIVRHGPHLAAISVMSWNSVGKPMASPTASPTNAPVAARFTRLLPRVHPPGLPSRFSSASAACPTV